PPPPQPSAPEPTPDRPAVVARRPGIRGVVRDTLGFPLPGATVGAQAGRGRLGVPVAAAETAADGSYEIVLATRIVPQELDRAMRRPSDQRKWALDEAPNPRRSTA